MTFHRKGENTMINFDNYLDSNYKFFLEEIQYNKLKPADSSTSLQFTCQDNIAADVADEGKLKVSFSRKLSFKPAGIYELTVIFGAIATINERGLKELDWKRINVADEIRNGNSTLLNNLVCRSSLQIAQITSSSGQAPVITPPGVAKPRE